MEVEGGVCGENRTPPSYASEKPSRHQEQPAVRLTRLPKRVQTAKDGKIFSSPRPSLRDPGCVQSGGGRTPLYHRSNLFLSTHPQFVVVILFLSWWGTNRNLGRKKKKITERKFCSFSFLEYTNSTKTTAPIRNPLWEE